MTDITPWLVPKSIIEIENLLSKIISPKVLEFGMGNSTIWFHKKFDCEIFSIEHDKEWYNKIKESIKNEKVTLVLKESMPIDPLNDLLIVSYADSVDHFSDEYFDLILIDGRNRVECFEHSERLLKKGGLLVLDNSERHDYIKIMNDYSTKTKETFVSENDPNGWSTTIWIK